jgi:hypothetical protein
MAVRVRRFDIGKDSSLEAINRFLLEEGVRSADVLHVDINPLGPDRTQIILVIEDSRAPRIILTFPTDGQAGVGPGSTVIATFSEPIQALASGDIEIFNITTNTLVPSTEYTINNTDVGLNRGIVRIEDTGPDTAVDANYLQDGNTFRVTFKTSIKDLDGNTMEEPFDLIFTSSLSQSSLDFDGDNVGAGSFTNPSLNQWEAIVTPARITISDTTLFQLTLRDDLGESLAGFTPHIDRTGASFTIRLEHDNKLLTPEPTAVLPTGLSIEWLAINGLG